MRDTMKRLVEARGFCVRGVADGHEALEYLSSSPLPELVLLDRTLPGMDGLEVLRVIRRRHSPGELPVIIVTGTDESDAVVEALELGANDYLAKPVDLPVAIARIRTQLARRQAERALHRERRALRAGDSRRQRRHLRLAHRSRRGALLAPVAGAARMRRRLAGDARHLVRPRAPRRHRAASREHRRAPGRPHRALRIRASRPGAERLLPVGAGPRRGGPECGRQADPPHRLDLRHHRRQGGRRAHGAPQSRAADGSPGTPARIHAAQPGVPGGRDVHRPRSLQDDQRQPGPSGRGCVAHPGGRAARRLRAEHRHRGALQRRRRARRYRVPRSAGWGATSSWWCWAA